ncbi:hypothetical protein Celaphus_00003724, partial [Cervus elaphus hippelaphus]
VSQEADVDLTILYLDPLYWYAKFQYKCGNYSGAAEYLYFFRVLVPPMNRNALRSPSGKLASEVFMQNWDAAMAQKKLRKYESLLVNDFFLVAWLEDYIENAKLFIFEFFVSKYTASISVPPLTCWQ